MSALQNQNSSSLISSIYKSRKIVLELMKKQGYNTDDYENFSINEVNSMKLNNQLDMLLEKEQAVENTPKRKIYIRYYLTKTLQKKNIDEIIDDLFHLEEILTKDDTLMIIVKEDMNETLQNLVKHIWAQDGIFMIVQSIRRLQYNILEHSLVPSHRLLTDKEVVEIRKRYNIKDDTQFPDISRFDPGAQVIGIRPGQVCEIIRTSKTAISSKYYRICSQ
jgi:DNA-directed RNA polymerase subunit H